MNDDEKAEYVWATGTHIGIIRDTQYSYSLYTTAHFYVEFILEKDNIAEIRAFKKGVHLEKYLNRINIVKLYTND